ncbi:MAG: VOC family protein [Porticoccaceae bacterium]|jgi:catechol 2,3-dioxygenase-like lactoylglutathione lyase family enzyme|nr:VOC family protein [Porticoccaceae bacterium]MEA3300726.1 VOC family protein [Pseudomonadota bacterium]HLS98659.1 VOC family protein [Porticoccaceae bacterium]
MTIFNHIVVGANDIDSARAFYDAALGALGVKRFPEWSPTASMYGKDVPEFMITKPVNGEPATHANGGTIGFRAANRAAVDAFHAQALANGGRCEGAPGPRAQAGPTAYGAYVRDPDGNKLCAFTFSAE